MTDRGQYFEDLDAAEDAFIRGEVPPKREAPKPPMLELTDAADLAGTCAPVREWIWDGVFSRRTVNMLVGVGAVGKSMVSLQVALFTALSRPLFGRAITGGPVIYFSCEDDISEMHRRLEALERGTRVSITTHGRLLLVDRVGKDNVLVAHDARTGLSTPTDAFEALLATAKAVGARLVIVDTVGQTYGGNENDRAQVTAYINALARIAQEIDGAVLLIAHRPKNGAEFSGSTGWDATVRARLLMEVREDEDGLARIFLRLAKANYAAPFEFELVRGEFGAFWLAEELERRSLTMGEKIDAYRAEAEVKQAFMSALDELCRQNRHVSHASRASNYAPKIIVAAGLNKGFSTKALDGAMQALFRDGVIKAGLPVGKGTDRKPIFGIARVAPPKDSIAPEEPAND
ncbi:AAA family ATPase [Geminicoccus harenae]|uniref:AAA family ATPase n=1 Tax=Geminicoccus harenae TaxID=2498453 RepID=UPI00168B4C30|nr:AAA family ATPase [Geminicoccus harenae]